jgi:hypothetical protein
MEQQCPSKFKIFVLGDTHVIVPEGRIYGLDSSLHKEFNTYEEALAWINYEGERNVDYVIIEVFRKR